VSDAGMTNAHAKLAISTPITTTRGLQLPAEERFSMERHPFSSLATVRTGG
jgi:hypothetical protein